jgi:hypothetical protein
MRSASTKSGGKIWDAALARSFKTSDGMVFIGGAP